MTKVQGTVKWFNNRKGYGFVSPTSDNSPTTEDIFVHQTSIFAGGDDYRTLTENAEVEFDVEKEAETGRYKAVNVTAPGGGPLTPPPRRKRAPKSSGGDGAQEGQDKSNGNNGRAKKVPPKKDPPFHSMIVDEVKETIVAGGLELGSRTTIDVSYGGARIKLGQGGYCGYCSSDAKIGEGTYTCDEQGVVTFDWQRSIEFVDGAWTAGDTSTLPKSLSLSDDGIGPVKSDETPESLWGEGKTDPKEAFEENGFQMRRVVLTRPPGAGRARRGKGGGKKS